MNHYRNLRHICEWGGVQIQFLAKNYFAIQFLPNDIIIFGAEIVSFRNLKKYFPTILN